jgi:hypothetical protein
MAKLVALITSQLEQSHAIGEAWQKAGAPGVTLVESHGLRRLQRAGKSSELLPGLVSMAQILRAAEMSSLMILPWTDSLVDRLVETTVAVLGDLTLPGMDFLVLDLERWGLSTMTITDVNDA